MGHGAGFVAILEHAKAMKHARQFRVAIGDAARLTLTDLGRDGEVHELQAA
jgi:hypothetical protein